MISEEQQGVVVCRALKDLHSNNELFIGQRVTKSNFDKVEEFCKGSLGIIEGWYVICIIHVVVNMYPWPVY